MRKKVKDYLKEAPEHKELFEGTVTGIDAFGRATVKTPTGMLKGLEMRGTRLASGVLINNTAQNQNKFSVVAGAREKAFSPSIVYPITTPKPEPKPYWFPEFDSSESPYRIMQIFPETGEVKEFYYGEEYDLINISKGGDYIGIRRIGDEVYVPAQKGGKDYMLKIGKSGIMKAVEVPPGCYVIGRKDKNTLLYFVWDDTSDLYSIDTNLNVNLVHQFPSSFFVVAIYGNYLIAQPFTEHHLYLYNINGQLITKICDATPWNVGFGGGYITGAQIDSTGGHYFIVKSDGDYYVLDIPKELIKNYPLTPIILTEDNAHAWVKYVAPNGETKILYCSMSGHSFNTVKEFTIPSSYEFSMGWPFSGLNDPISPDGNSLIIGYRDELYSLSLTDTLPQLIGTYDTRFYFMQFYLGNRWWIDQYFIFDYKERKFVSEEAMDFEPIYSFNGACDDYWYER